MIYSRVSQKSVSDSYNFIEDITFAYVGLPFLLDYWPPLIIKLLDISNEYSIVIATKKMCIPEKYVKEDVTNKTGESRTCKQCKFTGNLKNLVKETGIILIRKPKRIGILKCISKLFKYVYVGSNYVQRSLTIEKDINWWNIYYNALDEHNYDSVSINKQLVIYSSELEFQKGYNKFNDWTNSIPLYYHVDTLDLSEYKEYKQFCNFKVSIEFQKLDGSKKKLAGNRFLHLEQFSKYVFYYNEIYL